jgi:DNA/RNA-binding domain of Phe-tRNA-synthetase-like protein
VTAQGELRALLSRLAAQGWTYRQGRSHVVTRSPGGAVVVLASTPSCTRGRLNERSRLRRAGAMV